MPLRDEQIERYSRQIILPEVGARGQEQLLAAAVAVIGGGAVGATAVAYLAAAGVGRIDCFAAGTTVSCPYNAIDDQAHALRLVDDLNPDVEAGAHSLDAISARAASSASRYDAMLVTTADGTVRERAAAAAVAHHVPVILGVASGGTSWMGVFHGDVSTGPCPGCAVPDTNASATPAWLGETAATLIGALAALEVILLIIGKRTPLSGSVLHFDAAVSTMCEQPAVRGAGCVVCAAHGVYS